jgi:hypothetical protein
MAMKSFSGARRNSRAGLRFLTGCKLRRAMAEHGRNIARRFFKEVSVWA